MPAAVRERLESDGDANVADAPLAPAVYRQRLVELRWLGHVTLEVHRCTRGIDEPVAG